MQRRTSNIPLFGLGLIASLASTGCRPAFPFHYTQSGRIATDGLDLVIPPFDKSAAEIQIAFDALYLCQYFDPDGHLWITEWYRFWPDGRVVRFGIYPSEAKPAFKKLTDVDGENLPMGTVGRYSVLGDRIWLSFGGDVDWHWGAWVYDGAVSAKSWFDLRHVDWPNPGKLSKPSEEFPARVFVTQKVGAMKYQPEW